MNPATHARPTRTRLAALALALAALASLSGTHAVAPARAQVLQPWTPPGDTLMRRAVSAKARFQRQQGDSVGGDNYEAFDIVGQMGRGLLAALGRTHVSQARAIQPTLDSLGLDVEVATDPEQPTFVLMLVHNPLRPDADGVGFLYWYRGSDLRMQGSSFPAGRDPTLRVWWTGSPSSPYEAGVLFRRSGASSKSSPLVVRLYRMGADAYYWNLVQYEDRGPDLGPGAHGSFVDMNLDGRPELLVTGSFAPDSFLVLRGGTPQLVNELVYTERPEGFVLHDARVLPGPAETIRMFSYLMVNKQADRARRLLLKPALVDSALAHGWDRARGAGAWTVEYAEPDQAWPEWVELRVRERVGPKRYIVHFYIQDGRWVIRDWIPVQPGRPSAAMPDTTRRAGP